MKGGPQALHTYFPQASSRLSLSSSALLIQPTLIALPIKRAQTEDSHSNALSYVLVLAFSCRHRPSGIENPEVWLNFGGKSQEVLSRAVIPITVQLIHI